MRTIFFAFILATVICSAHASSGFVSYTLTKSAAPTADELDAYDRITKAMDSALFYYNTYTTIRKTLTVQYNTGVATADGSSNGSIRFGSGRQYMEVSTAMHEIAHTVGVGTTSEYAAYMVSGIFTGQNSTATLRSITGDTAALLHGDAMHIWPYGLNYASEVSSAADLINHCKIIESLYKDLFHESVAFAGRVRNQASQQCMIRTGTTLALGSCLDSTSLVRIIAMGDSAPVYRMEFGDRVLDVPNQSVATGIALGLYTWNSGANQKFQLEYQTQIAANVVRLSMVQSSLYLRASGTTIIQDAANASIANQYWELVDATAIPVANRQWMRLQSPRTHLLSTFDLLGRSTPK